MVGHQPSGFGTKPLKSCYSPGGIVLWTGKALSPILSLEVSGKTGFTLGFAS